MNRWRTPLWIAVIVPILGVFIVQFRAYLIDLQPNGANLGTIHPADFRVVSVILSLIPIGILAAVVKFSMRFRQTVAPWIAITPALLWSMSVIGWLYTHSRQSMHF
jgi:hypothetical protein